MSSQNPQHRAIYSPSKLLRLLSPITTVGELSWVRLLLLYAISNTFHLTSWNSKYWDQWLIYRDLSSLETTERICPIYRCKIPLSYLWERPLLQVGTWALRLAVIVAFALGAWFFWKILKKIDSIQPLQRSYATLLFLLIPINGARIGLSTARYSILFVALLLGALLMTNRNWYSTATGLFLLTYTSFQPSHQIFILAVILLLISIDFANTHQISLRTVSISVVILFIPFLHRFFLADAAVKLNLAGPDDGYNTVVPSFLIRAVLVCGALSGPFLVSIALHARSHQPWAEFRTSLIRIGFLLLALGSFPYIAVGHFANLSDWIIAFLPDHSDWDSRHQVLQGPGYAFLLTGLIGKVKEAAHGSLSIAIVIGCLVLNTSTYANYYVDGLKQRDVITALRLRSAELEGVSTYAFLDEARDVNARGRGVRDYEWDALTEEALRRQVEIIGMTDTVGVSGCVGEQIGKTITIRKISGRLKALITRSQIVDISVSDLVACK